MMKLSLPRIRREAAWVLLLVSLGIYYIAATAHLTDNRDIDSGDQGAYLNYAVNMLDSNYQKMGPRDRMPVYPYLLSKIHEDGMSREAFFERGKRFNILLSMAVLVIVFYLCRWWFPAAHCFTLYLTAAFGMFLFKAGYVQVELLYYLFAFVSFILFLRMLARPTWLIAAMAGVMTGLTHLTKASILPALAIFLTFAAAKLLFEFWRRRRDNRSGSLRDLAIGLGRLLLVPALFLAITWPYLANSKRAFGHYLYNVNSSIYIWADSFAEAKAGPGRHHDRYRWPDMPADQVPSAAKYWREHTPAQVAQRIGSGMRSTLSNLFGVDQYRRYLLLYLLAAVAVIAMRWKQAAALARNFPFEIGFCLCFFTAYILLFSWFAAISDNARFALTLFLPWLYVCSIPIADLGPSIAFKGNRFTADALWVFIGIIWIVVAANIVSVAGGHFPHI